MLTMKIFGDVISGNCYKVKLIADLTGQAYEWIDMDILKGDARAPAFTALNPVAKIPAVQFADGRVLTESNAILNYLARGTAYYPDDPFVQAQIQQWQFFEQYSHEPYIAVNRFIQTYQNMPANRQAQYDANIPKAHAALKVMDDHLATRAFFVTEAFTTADMALFAYTHVAYEGGFDLAAYPHIQGWVSHVKAQPGFVPMG